MEVGVGAGMSQRPEACPALHVLDHGTDANLQRLVDADDPVKGTFQSQI